MSTPHFCISVAFLQGSFHGRRDRGEPEWPPSPLRLFQALVAGAAVRWAEDGGRTNLTDETKLKLKGAGAAFRWLERLCERCPPGIIAPSAKVGSTYVLSIPDNRMDIVARAWSRGNYSNVGDANPATHRTMKPVRPMHLLGGDTLHYLWTLPEPLGDEERRHTEVLAAAARSIVALGWGIDVAIGHARVVSGADARRFAGERWRPLTRNAHNEAGLRVPMMGTFDTLVERHRKFLTRIATTHREEPSPLVEGRHFSRVCYARPTEQVARPFAGFALRPIDPNARMSWRAFRQERATCVAAMVRHVAWDAAQKDLDPRPGAWRSRRWAEQFVAGHGPRKQNGRFVAESWPRFSYLPLPTIDPRGVVGMIRRVLVAEPLPHLGGNGCSADWAANRLAGIILCDGETGRATALLEQLSSADSTLSRYVACDTPAREWLSATPVILPGYDDGKPTKRQRLLLECLSHAGYDADALESLEARAGGWLSGCAPAQAFRRPAYLRNLPALHVRIRFRAPACGPIALGAGRHCGLGVFAALDSG